MAGRPPAGAVHEPLHFARGLLEDEVGVSGLPFLEGESPG